MIKDLPKGLLNVVAEINKKSRLSFAEEQKALQEKMAAKQLAKMPMPAKPVSEPAAHKDAVTMAKKNMKEAVEGTVPKTAKEKQLAAMTPPKNKITHGDVLHGRGVKKEEVEQVDEARFKKGQDVGKPGLMFGKIAAKAAKRYGSAEAGKRVAGAVLKKVLAKEDVEYTDDEIEQILNNYDQLQEAGKVVSGSPFSKDYKPQGDKPGEKAGFTSKKISTGTVYSRKPAKDMKEATDTPGNSAHQCAIHVKSEQFGEGKTLFSQHAEPDADGNIAWYDVMFEHGIEKQVPTSALEVLMSESHMNHKKAKKEC